MCAPVHDALLIEGELDSIVETVEADPTGDEGGFGARAVRLFAQDGSQGRPLPCPLHG